MVQSVLGSLTLGYRPLWNGARQLAGIQLYVQDLPGSYVDAPHLLRTLQEMWSASSPPLLISPQSRQLLLQLLQLPLPLLLLLLLLLLVPVQILPPLPHLYLLR